MNFQTAQRWLKTFTAIDSYASIVALREDEKGQVICGIRCPNVFLADLETAQECFETLILFNRFKSNGGEF